MDKKGYEAADCWRSLTNKRKYDFDFKPGSMRDFHNFICYYLSLATLAKAFQAHPGEDWEGIQVVFGNAYSKDSQTIRTKIIHKITAFELLRNRNIMNMQKMTINSGQAGLETAIQSSNPKEMMLASIRILKTIRNNIFHGDKNPKYDKDIEAVRLALPILELLVEICFDYSKDRF